MLYLHGAKGERHDLLYLLNRLRGVSGAKQFILLVAQFQNALQARRKVKKECVSLAYSRKKNAKRKACVRLRNANRKLNEIRNLVAAELKSITKLVPPKVFEFADEYVGIFDYDVRSNIEPRLIAMFMEDSLPSGDKDIC